MGREGASKEPHAPDLVVAVTRALENGGKDWGRLRSLEIKLRKGGVEGDAENKGGFRSMGKINIHRWPRIKKDKHASSTCVRGSVYEGPWNMAARQVRRTMA